MVERRQPNLIQAKSGLSVLQNKFNSELLPPKDRTPVVNNYELGANFKCIVVIVVTRFADNFFDCTTVNGRTDTPSGPFLMFLAVPSLSAVMSIRNNILSEVSFD